MCFRDGMHAAHTLVISDGSTKGDYRGVQKWYFEVMKDRTSTDRVRGGG
jgi:hypothetical protein